MDGMNRIDRIRKKAPRQKFWVKDPIQALRRSTGSSSLVRFFLRGDLLRHDGIEKRNPYFAL